MCGRKTLIKSKKAIIEELMIDDWQIEDYLPSYNIAPSQYSTVVIEDEGSNVAKSMRWGLIPSWSKNYGQCIDTNTICYYNTGNKVDPCNGSG